MRYKNPSIPDVLEQMRKRNYDRIIVLPMFPHYASASTGSAVEEVMRVMQQMVGYTGGELHQPVLRSPYIPEAFVERGRKYNIADYDHVLFSYHGLPERQVDKVYVDGSKCSDHRCEDEITEDNKFCYKATSYATSRLLAAKLNIPADKYTTCFQSRLDQKWLKPFSGRGCEAAVRRKAPGAFLCSRLRSRPIVSRRLSRSAMSTRRSLPIMVAKKCNR